MENPIVIEGKTFVPSGRRVKTPRGPVHCAKCRAECVPSGITPGYAIAGRRKLCYTCAWKREREYMVRTGHGVLYLTRSNQPDYFDVVGPYFGLLAPGIASYSEHKGRFRTREEADARAADCMAERARHTGPGMPDLPLVTVREGPRPWRIGNWPGVWNSPTLAVKDSVGFVPGYGRTRRYSVRFTGPDGETWHGTRGDSMDCIRVRRCKGKD